MQSLIEWKRMKRNVQIIEKIYITSLLLFFFLLNGNTSAEWIFAKQKSGDEWNKIKNNKPTTAYNFIYLFFALLLIVCSFICHTFITLLDIIPMDMLHIYYQIIRLDSYFKSYSMTHTKEYTHKTFMTIQIRFIH